MHSSPQSPSPDSTDRHIVGDDYVTWTLPRTWATGEPVTAAQLNQQLRDNQEYLKLEIDMLKHVIGELREELARLKE